MDEKQRYELEAICGLIDLDSFEEASEALESVTVRITHSRLKEYITKRD